MCYISVTFKTGINRSSYQKHLWTTLNLKFILNVFRLRKETGALMQKYLQNILQLLFCSSSLSRCIIKHFLHGEKINIEHNDPLPNTVLSCAIHNTLCDSFLAEPVFTFRIGSLSTCLSEPWPATNLSPVHHSPQELEIRRCSDQVV